MIVIAIIAGTVFFSSDLPDGLESFINNNGLHRFSGNYSAPFNDYKIAFLENRNWNAFLSGTIGAFLCAGFFLFIRFLFQRLTRLHKQD